MKTTIFAALIFLSACTSKPKQPLTLYQPEYLFLEAGKTISTKEGEFTPQTDQIWVSQKKLLDLEEKLSRF